MYSKTSNSSRGAAALFGLSLLTLFHADALASTVGDWVDISSLVTTEQGSTLYNRTSREYQSTVTVTNDSGDELTGPVRLVIATANKTVLDADGVTDASEPYFSLLSVGDQLSDGGSLKKTVSFTGRRGQAVYRTRLEQEQTPPPPPQSAVLRIGGGETQEGDDGAREIPFLLTLSRAVGGDVSVDYASADFSATAGEDYSPVNGTLTIPAGQMEGEIRVPVIGDRDSEADERFIVLLSNLFSADVELTSGRAGVGTILDDDTPPIPSANLTNDSTYVGADGASIRTLSDTLRRPIEVDIRPALAPVEPLPDDMVRVGGYYAVSAHQDTWTNNGSVFILSLPVPSGADREHLALAKRVAMSDFLDAAGSGWVWILLSGQYDAAANMFRTLIPFLAEEADTIALVSHRDFDSRAPGGTPGIRTALTTNGPEPDDVIYRGFDFTIQCEGFSLLDPCNSRLTGAMAAWLVDLRGSFRQMGYPEPWLKPHLTGDLTGFGIPKADGYTVYVSPKEYGPCAKSNNRGGFYRHWEFKLVLCVANPLLLGPDNLDDLTHEFFHSLQSAFPATRESQRAGRAEEWVMEGTATAAMRSYQTTLVATKMNRTPEYSPRKIHIGLRNPGTRAEVLEYETQDLWVYAGRTRGDLDIGAAIIVFALGADIAAANSGFLGFRDSLVNMYWEWVKNQAYEKNERFADEQGGNEVLGPGCKLETENGATVDPNEIGDFGILVSPSGWSGRIGPLSTKVVRFRLPKTDWTVTWKKWIFIGLNKLGDDVKYKVYDYEGRSPCGGGIPDGLRPLDNLRVETDYYILISNVNFDKGIDVLLSGDLAEVY